MADTWTVAFGRYLRTLRERRGLSLQEVTSLSQAFADPVDKGYLSRCENGRQRLAFSKAIPLCRIYKIPADALLERMELDMELDRLGGPQTDSMHFDELTVAGREAMVKTDYWRGYAFLRDAAARVLDEPRSTSHSTVEELVAHAQTNCATGARALGKYKFAWHEFHTIMESGNAAPRTTTLLINRLSVTSRSLGRYDEAREFADKGIAAAEASGDWYEMGHAYTTRAIQAYFDGELEHAASLYRKAHDQFREGDHEWECARTLLNMGQAYMDLGRVGTARRSLQASIKIAESLNQRRVEALGEIVLGELDVQEGRELVAERRWRKAADIGKQLNDRDLQFKAELRRFKHAKETGKPSIARAVERRLTRLAPAISGHLEDLREFDEIRGGEAPRPTRARRDPPADALPENG